MPSERKTPPAMQRTNAVERGASEGGLRIQWKSPGAVIELSMLQTTGCDSKGSRISSALAVPGSHALACGYAPDAVEGRITRVRGNLSTPSALGQKRPGFGTTTTAQSAARAGVGAS